MKRLSMIVAVLALSACATPSQELPIHPTVAPISPYGLKWLNQYAPISAGFSTGCAGNVIGCPGSGSESGAGAGGAGGGK